MANKKVCVAVIGVGATILHGAITSLFVDCGVRIDRTYQLNFGGYTDFLYTPPMLGQ